MTHTVREEDFSRIAFYWTEQAYGLAFPSIFVTPAYLESWWQVFGVGQLNLLSVWQDNTLLGIAPLQLNGGTASLIGSPDVCDYLDFVTLDGGKDEFFNTLMDSLQERGISKLDLNPVRADSRVMSNLVQMAQRRGYRVSQEQEEVSLEMVLPQSWEEYLSMLNGKQRHELQRKLRRLDTAGKVEYQIIQDEAALASVLPEFLSLFSNSKGEKAGFMTEKMAEFFRRLTINLSSVNLLRCGSLKLSGRTIAMVMCFDYNDIIYLYNSVYELDYSTLSPGIVAKALYIQDSIAKGKKVFNFLKGSETYKYQMGGKEVPIYHLQVNF